MFIGSNTVSKAQIALPENKGEQRRRGRENINDTHPQYPPPQKEVETKGRRCNSSGHEDRRRNNSYATLCRYDRPFDSSSRTSEHRANHPTPESGPSAPHQETSDGAQHLWTKVTLRRRPTGRGSGRLWSLARARRKLGKQNDELIRTILAASKAAVRSRPLQDHTTISS
jgi:hypothetical protein